MVASLPGFAAPPAFVTVDGRKLAYTEVCPAEPRGTVLLLTGLAAKRQGWYHQMGPLGALYRTIAIDHRDAGDSDLTPAPYTTGDQADDAAEVLRALGVSQAAVVGISMGGFVTLELALRHPELVSRMTLTSTSAGGPTHVRPRVADTLSLLLGRIGSQEPGARALRTYRRITAPGFADAHPEDMARIAQIGRYRPQSAAAYQRQWRACLGHDVTTRLSQITALALVIHGTADPLVRVENGRYLAQHVPGARYLEYAGIGHVPIIECPEAYNRDVLAFLAG
ncbi:MAG TPA: alpha/beta fold hydrolase [Ktedonobacterales bacterium]